MRRVGWLVAVMLALPALASAQLDTDPPTITVVASTDPAASIIIRFSEAAGPANADSVRWTDRYGGPVSAQRRCRSGGSIVSCAGFVDEVELDPVEPRALGLLTTIIVNADDVTSPIRDPAGNAAATLVRDVRTATWREESGSGVTLRWARFASSAAGGGVFRAERLADATLVHRFRGSSVRWHTRVGPRDGEAAVSVDGTSLGVIDLYAPSASFVDRVFGGFASDAQHTIVVRVRGSRDVRSRDTWIVADGFTAGGVTLGEDRFFYRWTPVARRDASGDLIRRARTVGATATIRFAGGGIDWWHGVGPDEGIVEVYVDGRKVREIDGSAAAAGLARRRVSGLGDRIHALVLRATGRAGARGGRFVTLDRVTVRASVRMFAGLGAWIDLFDYDSDTSEPAIAAMVATMDEHGVRTLYLETARYNSDGAFLYPAKIVYWLSQARAAGIKVVGWYFPAYSEFLDIDVQRSAAIAAYRSPRGDRFDALGVDIEFRHEADSQDQFNAHIPLQLRRVRALVGVSYPISAIMPPPNQMDLAPSTWAGFPWAAIGAVADVAQPMAYSSYRKGSQCPDDPQYCTRAYTRNAVTRTRAALQNSEVVVHVIGGIADRLTQNEFREFVKGVADARPYGASMYDVRTTSAAKWEILEGIG